MGASILRHGSQAHKDRLRVFGMRPFLTLQTFSIGIEGL